MPTIDNCSGCPYREYGPAIGPSGDLAASVVLVGEAPGRQEIEQGLPFIGPAGRLLRGALAESGIDVSGVFITNAVACLPHPVKPRVAAINACHERLMADLAAHPRRVIVTLGATALRAVNGKWNLPMLKARGQVMGSDWGPVLPTLHPARVLRRRAERSLLVADLMLASGLARSTNA